MKTSSEQTNDMKTPLLTQFDLHHRLFNNVLDGFTDEETNQRLHGNTAMNHVKYLAGHLQNSQYGIALALGLDIEVKWNDMFAGMGFSQALDNFNYPTIEEIKREWNQLYTPIRHGIEKISVEQLNEKPAAPFDQVANSVGELWTFLNHHIAYHIGQIGILRRGFGKPPMRYD